MVPQHNLKSKNIKEKSGSQSGHPVETPDKDLRRARKALPGGPGGDEKTGVPGAQARREARKESIKKGASREPKARPGGPTCEAAACYSPTPSRVQYHRRAWP